MMWKLGYLSCGVCEVINIEIGVRQEKRGRYLRWKQRLREGERWEEENVVLKNHLPTSPPPPECLLKYVPTWVHTYTRYDMCTT